MILLPDQTQRQVFEESIKGVMGKGKTLMFAHGFNIHFNQVVPPPDVDVSMIAPKAPGHVMRDLFTQGPGVPAPGRGLPGRVGQGARHGPGLRQGRRLHARRRHRDHVQGGDGDRSLRRADDPLRRRVAPDQGRVRDPRRGGLPARGRLLRVHARDEADRGPVLPGRPRLHALLGVRHRGVRRLHARAADHRRPDQAGDEEDPLRDPVAASSPASGCSRTRRTAPSSSPCGSARPSIRSRRWAGGCAR